MVHRTEINGVSQVVIRGERLENLALPPSSSLSGGKGEEGPVVIKSRLERFLL